MFRFQFESIMKLIMEKCPFKVLRKIHVLLIQNLENAIRNRTSEISEFVIPHIAFVSQAFHPRFLSFFYRDTITFSILSFLFFFTWNVLDFSCHVSLATVWPLLIS